MSNKVISKFKTFINKEEAFLNKKILFIDFKNNDYFWFENSSDGLLFENINNSNYLQYYENFKQFISRNKKNKFDFVIVIKDNISYRRFTNDMRLIQNKYCKNGTRLFIEKHNKQTLASYFSIIFEFTKNKILNLKKKNLMFDDQLLVYDYYYSCISLTTDLKPKSWICKILSIKYVFFNIIDFQRFYFFATHVFIKYQYVARYSDKKNT